MRQTNVREAKALRCKLQTLAGLLSFAFALNHVGLAQTYTVLHSFTGDGDGSVPVAAVTIDSAGNLYGTASEGAATTYPYCYPDGCGTVFKLQHTAHGWVFSTLFMFQGELDGKIPAAPVTIGRDGSLYGTASGTYTSGCGIVFNLKPPARRPVSVLAPWSETILHLFNISDGCTPYSAVIFDQSGNLYGTTETGGIGYGNVYEMSPSNGGWTLTNLYNFDFYHGAFPGYSGVAFDQSGSLYGTTFGGGNGDFGVVFKLNHSGSGWTNSVLYTFSNGSDGAYPEGGVVFDSSGNMYGSTVTGGSGGGGTVFQLMPEGGNWSFNLVYSLYSLSPDGGPYSQLTMDNSGNLYGTTRYGGLNNQGTVFKLTPSNGSWLYTSLHDFYCQSDGCNPIGSVTIDAQGNLYGTAAAGGENNYGTVWEVTP